MKSSEAGTAIIEEGMGEVDDLLGAVSKLSLCLSTRSAAGVCSTISGGRGDVQSLLRQRLEAGFESSLVLHTVPVQPYKMADNINSLYPILRPIRSI